MARVLGPNNIPITAATGGAPTRASGDDFGAQIGAAEQKFGNALESVGRAAQIVSERREKAAEDAFLDKADLELDLTYGRISQEEQTKATSGADGMFDSVRSRLESETDPVFDRLREQGYRPSEEAINKARSIATRRQHQHLTKALVYENNERVRNFSAQLDGSLATIAQSGAQSGDIDSALARAEQSIEAHKGILPAVELDKMRQVAAGHFYNQALANSDPEALEGLQQKLTREKPSEPAKDDAIGRAAAATGVPDGMLRAFAKIESGGNASARTGSYKGLFQLSDGEFGKHGGGNVYNADDNAMAAARKLKQESATFQDKYGRAPTATDLYLVHQQGEGGYDAHISNPNAPAWQNMASTGEGQQKGAGWAKLAIWGNIPSDVKSRFPGGVESVTSADFIKIWDEKVKRFGGEAADTSIRGNFANILTEKAPEIARRAEEAREKRADAQRANLILSGQLLVDPNSKDDKAVIDKAFAASNLAGSLREADPTAAAALTDLAKKTGYVPDDSMSALRAMSVNGDPSQKAFAYETAANLMREKPGIFEGGSNVKELKADATLYETYTTDMGLSPETAIARIGELRTPEFEKRREAIKKDLESNSSVMKQVTGDDLTKEFDGWFSSAPAIGGSPGQAAVIVDTYRDLVKDNYVKTGDIEVAKAMAKKDLLRTYAVSDVTGKKRLMRNPPEKYYPAIEPRAGKEPDHSYITNQLLADVKERSGKDIPIEDIYIEPIPQTNSDIRAGRYPRYGVVWFEERDGVRVMQTTPGAVFFADVKAEQERQTANREQRFREERRKEVERQERLTAGREQAKGVIRRLLHPEDALTPIDRSQPDLTVR